MKRIEDSLRDLWDNIKCTNIRIIGVSEEEEKKKGTEKIFEEIIVENLPNMGKEIVSQVQEAQRVPYRINPRRNTPRDILIKLSKIKYKEKVSKAAREKKQITYKGIPVWLTADLSAETLQTRREWQDIFKVLKWKNLQPRLLYPARISFRFDGEIKIFIAKQKLSEFSTTKPALQQMLKELLQVGNTREEKTYNNKPKTIKKIVIGTYISIITINVNGLNAPTKRHRLAEWIKKQDPYICCLKETNFRPRDTYRLKVRGWKKIFHANGNQKKAGVAIYISDKIDFKIKTITKDKEGQYLMIKGSIQEKDITIVNIYAPNIGAPQYIRQMLTAIKGEIDSNTVIIGDFNSPLSPVDRSSKMKINKETQVLNDTLNKMDLIDIYRAFHPKTTEYTFFSGAHGTFSRIDNTLGHKSSLGKFKKIEIISSIFSDHNAMRLDINYRKKNCKK